MGKNLSRSRREHVREVERFVQSTKLSEPKLSKAQIKDLLIYIWKNIPHYPETGSFDLRDWTLIGIYLRQQQPRAPAKIYSTWETVMKCLTIRHSAQQQLKPDSRSSPSSPPLIPAKTSSLTKPSSPLPSPPPYQLPPHYNTLSTSASLNSAAFQKKCSSKASAFSPSPDDSVCGPPPPPNTPIISNASSAPRSNERSKMSVRLHVLSSPSPPAKNPARNSVSRKTIILSPRSAANPNKTPLPLSLNFSTDSRNNNLFLNPVPERISSVLICPRPAAAPPENPFLIYV